MENDNGCEFESRVRLKYSALRYSGIRQSTVAGNTAVKIRIYGLCSVNGSNSNASNDEKAARGLVESDVVIVTKSMFRTVKLNVKNLNLRRCGVKKLFVPEDQPF